MQHHSKNEILLTTLVRINQEAQSGAFENHKQYCSNCRCYRFDPLLNRYEVGAYTGFAPGSISVFDCTRRYDFQPVKFDNAVRYHLSSINKVAEQRLRP